MAEALSIDLVLTAHPTEARRRTTLVALRRCYRLLERLDDPRLTQAEDAEVRRQLREEIALLWHTSALRVEAPSPLDEVRSVMAFFDESLFVIAPAAVPRDGPGARCGGAGGRRPLARMRRARRRRQRPFRDAAAAHRPFLRWGSWVGGDRDGNPNVTAATTREAMRIQSDHVLRGYEAVARRLMQTVAAIVPEARTDPRSRARLADDAARLPGRDGGPGPALPAGAVPAPVRGHRGAAAPDAAAARGWSRPGRPRGGRRVHRAGRSCSRSSTSSRRRSWAAGWRGPPGATSRTSPGSSRRSGSTRWTWRCASTARSTRPRSRRSMRTGATAPAPRCRRPRSRVEVSHRVTAGEVLATFRAIAQLQAEFGAAACHRYVISFTRGAQDVLDVLELAGRVGRPAPVLDVVPLFESADALATAGPSWSSCWRSRATDATWPPGATARR